MSGNYGLYFNEATGEWDNVSNWTAEGWYNHNIPEVPTTSAPVYLTATVLDLHADGQDQAANIAANGASAGQNTLDIGGTLSVGGMSSFSSFDVIVDPGAAFLGGQLALYGADMQIYGYESLSNGGGGTLQNAAITVEAGGTLVAAELNGMKTDTLLVEGTLHLTGGGPGVGMSNTVGAHGLVIMDGFEDAGTEWSIQGGTFSSSLAYQNGTFNFSGTGGVLDLPGNSLSNSNITVTGFSAGDTLVLGTITGTDAVTATIVNGDTFELLQDGKAVAQIDHFTLAPGATLPASAGSIVDGHYVVNYCFCAGTHLATADGDIPVQDIVPGTMLKTASGALLPVRWVGWSEVDLHFADPLRAMPIRICAGALADGVPARDLLVSPDHAVFLDGILAQAGALVNGASILREQAMPRRFRYYHIELATHELLLAENCPAESFVDNVDRMYFHNWDERTAPDEAVAEMPFPRAKSARQVPAALRHALAERAATLIPPRAA